MQLCSLGFVVVELLFFSDDDLLDVEFCVFCFVIRAIITFELSVISESFTLYCVEATFVSGFAAIDCTTLAKVKSGLCCS